MLPPFDTGETLTRLESEVAALRPRILVFLGDSFHDGKAESRLCAKDAARIASLAAGRTLMWVVGNHDADGPRALAGDVVAELALGVLDLVHEPAVGPSPRRGRRTPASLRPGPRAGAPACGAAASSPTASG